jgi:hypothetical protein
MIGLIPVVMRIQLAKVAVLAQAADVFTFALPLPMKFRTARQCAAEDHVVFSVVIMLNVASGICNTNQLLVFVVTVVRYQRTGLPMCLCTGSGGIAGL